MEKSKIRQLATLFILSVMFLVLFNAKTALADGTQTVGDFTYTTNDETKTAILSACNAAELTEVTIPSTIPVTVDGASVEYTVTEIGASAFASCSNITEVTIPDSVTSMGTSAFKQSGITKVTLGTGITELPEQAFYHCSSLETIEWPSNLQSIGASAFYQCTGLTELTIPKSVIKIGDSAFQSCTKVTSIQFEERDSETSIEFGKYVFGNCSALSSLELPSVLTAIPDYFLNNSSMLKELTLPEKVESIGASAFSKSGIQSITLPNSLTSIGASAFAGCKSLVSITFPENLKTIGDRAFFQCHSLIEAELPDNTTDLGTWVFYDCRVLKKLTFPKNLKTIPEKFVGAGIVLKEVVLPEKLESIGTGAFLSCSFEEITIPDTVTSIGNEAFKTCKNLTAITIPDGVTEIGASTFNGCSALETVTFGKKVTTIGNQAFSGCTALKSLTLPATLTSVPTTNHWVQNCTALEAILVEEGNESFVSVDGVLFDKDKTTLLAYPGAKKGAYTVPSTVKTLAPYSFNYCAGLTEIDFSNVEEMGSRTFQGCSGLKQVVIPASVTSLSDAFYLCKSLNLAFFKGDVPTFTSSTFSSVAAGFKILYLAQYTNWAQTDNAYVTKYTREAVANEAAGNAEIFKNQQSDILAEDIYSIQIEDKEAVQAALNVYNALDDATKANLTEQKALLDELLDQIAVLESEPVDELIAAIGEVSLDSEAAITQAREAYDALDDAAKAKADGETLTAAEARLAQLKAIADVEEKIAAIGEVSLDSEAAITQARAAYDALDDAAKAETDNTALIAAETRLAQLKAIADVEEKIAAIGTVTLDSQTVIAAARAAYDVLEEAIKEEVSNYAVLTQAEAVYAKLAAIADVEEKIAAIGTVTLDSQEAIAQARAAYNALEASLKKRITNYADLLAAEEEYAQIASNQSLATAKAEACTALENYLDSSKYRDAQQVEITEIIAKAKEEIEASENASQVTKLVANAKKKLDVIKTNEQLTKEEKEAKAAEEAKKKAEEAKKLAQQKAKFKAAVPTVKAAATKTYKNIKVSWNKVTDAKGYYVYRKTGKNGTYKKLAAVTKTSYTDKTAACGKTYYYTVKAYNADGTSSYNKTGIKAVNNVPAAVKLKSTKAGTKKATVKWSKTTGASGYQVYMAASKKGTYKKVATLSGKSKVSYIKKSLKKGKTYYFKVRAYKTVSGKKVYGAYSNVKSVKIKK